MSALRYVGFVVFGSVTVLILGCNNTSTPDASESGPRSAATANKSEPSVENQPVIAVTPKAVESITQILKEQGIAETWYLRVRVVPGGCCGFMHKLDLDTEISPSTDHIFESGGIKVVILKRQVEMLRGAKVDYGEDREKQGFIIKNPNFEGESLKKWLPVLTAEAPPAANRKAGQLSERISQFRKMATDDPDNELAHYRLG